DMECVGQPPATEYDFGGQIKSLGGHQSPCDAKRRRTGRNALQEPADSKGEGQRNYQLPAAVVTHSRTKDASDRNCNLPAGGLGCLLLRWICLYRCLCVHTMMRQSRLTVC